MTAPEHWARRAGRMVKGFLIGLGLPLAILELIALAGDVAPFKYQGF